MEAALALTCVQGTVPIVDQSECTRTPAYLNVGEGACRDVMHTISDCAAAAFSWHWTIAASGTARQSLFGRVPLVTPALKMLPLLRCCLPGAAITPAMICAGQQPFPPTQVWPAIQPVDSCQGDSGGEPGPACLSSRWDGTAVAGQRLSWQGSF